jgi:hypothetical protein
MVPIEHFLLSTGLTIQIVGSYTGSSYRLNAVLMKNGRAGDIREGDLLKGVVGFAHTTSGEHPSVKTAIVDLTKVISGKTVWFGDDSVKIPELSV